MTEEKTFMKITNKDIYNRIQQMDSNNIEAHALIIEHQEKTNGKVKLNRWIATTAMTFIIALMGWFISNLIMNR